MKYLIGIDEPRQEVYNRNLINKQSVGINAIEYAQNYVVLDDISEFLENMVGTFERLFKEQTQGAFNKAILLEKRYELVGFQLHKLQAFSSAYKSIDIKLNSELDAVEKVDFNIYLTDATEIKKYKAKEKFINDLYDYQKSGGEFKSALILKALPLQFIYNYSSNEIKPSI